MAKKKNRSRRRKQKQQQAVKITQKDIDQGREAIKTMIKGAIILAIFICFFAFKIGDQTMYERTASLFASDEAPQSSVVPEKSPQ